MRCECDVGLYKLLCARWEYFQELLKTDFHKILIREDDWRRKLEILRLNNVRFYLFSGLGFMDYVGFRPI